MTVFIMIVILGALIGIWYLLVFIVAASNEKQEQELKNSKNISNNPHIKSISYSKKEVEHVLIIIDIILSITTIAISILVGLIDREMYKKEINESMFKDMEYLFDIDSEFYAEKKAEILSQYNDWITYMSIAFLIGIVMIYVTSSVLEHLLNNMRKSKLKITDEHIIATGDKGRTTILPYENIFSVSEGGIKGVTLYTSIGKVTFHLIKNRNEIIKAISQKIKLDKSVNIQ